MAVGPSFSQTIFNLPAIRNYQASREAVKQAQAQDVVSREEVSLVVVTQYLLILRAEAAYEAAKTRFALAERLFRQAEELQKTGIG